MKKTEFAKQIKKKLKKKTTPVFWLDMELKLRQGENVPKIDESRFNKYSNLLYAPWEKKDLLLTENLIEVGADLNIQDESGETVLSKAIKENKLKLIEILKKYKKKIDFTIGKIKYLIIFS